MFYKSFFKSILKRPNALIAFFIYTTLIAFAAYELGKIPQKENIQTELLVAFLLSFAVSGGVSFLNHFIDSQIKNEIQAETKNLKAETEKLKQEYNQEEIFNKQILDFLSFVQEKIPPEQFTDYSLRRPDESFDKFKKRLKDNLSSLQISHEALNTLIFTYTKSRKGKDVMLLKHIVAHAIEDELTYIKDDAEFDKKFNHLYAYLRGWLICSIKYDTDKLPLNWIKDTYLEREEKIKLINYVKNLLISNKRGQELIPNEESRKLIARYLDTLIEKIQEEQASLPLSN